MPFRVIYTHAKGKEKHTGASRKEIKTMTEKTARQIENLKAQTFGVEVEGNNITRQKAAKVAADFFGTGRSVCGGS